MTGNHSKTLCVYFCTILRYNVKVMRTEKLDLKQRQRFVGSLKTVGSLIFPGFLYLSFFYRSGYGIPCFFKRITGLKCPGCGMSHAALEIVKGDFRAAFDYNKLSVTLVPVILLYLLYRDIRYIKSGSDEFSCYDIIFLLLCMLICIWYFLYRNF